MQTPPPVQRPVPPPVLLVNAHAKSPSVQPNAAVLPLLEDKERLIRYGKWGGLALLGLLVLSALMGDGGTSSSDSDSSSSYSSSSGGSYEDRMNAGIAELGGTYDSTTGTMTTNR